MWSTVQTGKVKIVPWKDQASDKWWVGEHAEAAKPSPGLGGLGLDGRGDALNFNLLEEHKEKKDLWYK